MLNNSSLATTHPPKGNRLLAALPAADYKPLLPHLESVALPVGSSLYESSDRMTHVFFPTEGIVSLLSVMDNGDSSESP